MMYKFIRNVFLICGLAGNAHATDVMLSWLPSEGSVRGYYVYRGTSIGDFSNRIDAGTNTQVELSGLQPCQNYYFVVTAYDSTGNESPPSNQIAYCPPGLALVNVEGHFTLKYALEAGHSYKIQASTDLRNWTVIDSTSQLPSDIAGRLSDPENYSARFFRIVQD